MANDNDKSTGFAALKPVMIFIAEHDDCGGSFKARVRYRGPRERRVYALTCSGCGAKLQGRLPGPDARYVIILYSISYLGDS